MLHLFWGIKAGVNIQKKKKKKNQGSSCMIANIPISQLTNKYLSPDSELMSIKFFLMLDMTDCTFRAAHKVPSHVLCNYNVIIVLWKLYYTWTLH